jgi:hypothetical protein
MSDPERDLEETRMKARGHILLLAAIVSAAPLVSVGTPAQAAGNPQVCSGYAQNYARKNSRGPIAGGITFGAIGGAIVGGILGGPPGAAVGAAIGGGGGGAAGGVARSRNYNALYAEAYDGCMAS